MDNEKLNEKLAQWAGFKYQLASNGDWVWFDSAGLPLSPTGLSGEPLFTESLDACFKWLVPEAIKRFGELKVRWMLLDWVDKVLIDVKYGVPPSSLLCVLLEKLIEAENE